MSSKKQTYELNGQYIGPGGVISGSGKYTVEKPMFPYGCRYCGREKTVSAPENSCNRPACNDAWKKEHSGIGDKILRRFK